ncbi:phage antirepressor KilAC domain-containing protein [Eubacterium sp. 1001713B170207_170306_E7]|uniref:phage antirepressor KilAC domain-containing protein n=1 Tax=Eubacterium sp. 1001713B170207_170306_E7 TaxID=2787097 RepID=UPI00189B0732|nr:phage antirepressor KilAC domain-containing protein [Eubacterium sp. 1001713B170207_170306_E7]
MNRKQTTPAATVKQKKLRPWCASCALKQEDRVLGGFESLSDIDQYIELFFIEKQLEALQQDYNEKMGCIKRQTSEPKAADPEPACSVQELAGKMQASGIDIGRNQLYSWLRHNGYARYQSQGTSQHLPTEEALAQNYMVTEKVPCREKRTGRLNYNTRLLVTGRGQDFFIKALRAERSSAAEAVGV